MNIDEAKIFFSDTKLKAILPLTKATGKVRIKTRSFFGEYGLPVSPRKIKLGQSNYVEWQIGYDLEATNENRGKTSLKDMSFVNYKGVHKYAYELSEILYYSANSNLISLNEIRDTFINIQKIAESDTFEKMESMNICRTNPISVDVNGIDFFKMTVSYPMLVHKFGQYDIYAEVVIKEKQRAVGTQAMLYVCIPVTMLKFKTSAIGRTLNKKESADWIIGREEALLSLELFRIFGMLSPKHRFDVIAIFKMLFPSL